MKKLYCGGRFCFDYREPSYQEKAREDYRVAVLGSVERLLYRQPQIVLRDDLTYVGPFYFTNEGMVDREIVKTEYDMIVSCTHAVFFLENGVCPGTVSEMTLASMMGKKVYIFYLQGKENEETESSLHTPCWYPILLAEQINRKCRLFPCRDRADAKEKIKRLIEGLA